MELTVQQQIFDQLKKSNKIAVVMPEILTADNLASGLALRLFLQKLNKDVIIASSGRLPEVLSFLPGARQLRDELGGGKSLVVTLDTSQKQLEEISYQTAADKAQIFLKAKAAEFTVDDLSFASEKFPLDLIVTIDAKSLEDLGGLYEQNADLFFETAKINIDNKAANEYFGAINLVDITATSAAEILAELLQKYEGQLIDEDIATCLLTGIIAKTHSFQHSQTTPRAFLKASELVALGGRQQEVVKNIYKTKSLPLLKFWGRALARMKIDERASAVYSVLTVTDFEKAESGRAEILPALREFIDNISGYKIIALITESEKDRRGLLAAIHEQLPAEKFLESFNSGARLLETGLNNYRLIEAEDYPGSLENLEDRFLEAIKHLG